MRAGPDEQAGVRGIQEIRQGLIVDLQKAALAQEVADLTFLFTQNPFQPIMLLAQLANACPSQSGQFMIAMRTG